MCIRDRSTNTTIESEILEINNSCKKVQEVTNLVSQICLKAKEQIILTNHRPVVAIIAERFSDNLLSIRANEVRDRVRQTKIGVRLIPFEAQRAELLTKTLSVKRLEWMKRL